MAQLEKVEMRAFNPPPDMDVQPPLPFVGRDFSSLRARTAELRNRAASLLEARDTRVITTGEVPGSFRKPREIKRRVVRSALG